MKTSTNPNAQGILVTLTFIALFFVSLIVMLVADVDAGSFFEDKVNAAINSQIQAKASAINPAVATSTTAQNNLFYELGNP